FASYLSSARRAPHSFPTRRSSDLWSGGHTSRVDAGISAHLSGNPAVSPARVDRARPGLRSSVDAAGARSPDVFTRVIRCSQDMSHPCARRWVDDAEEWVWNRI